MIGLSLEPNFLGGGVGGENNTTFENKESATIIIIICSCCWTINKKDGMAGLILTFASP